MFNAIFDFRYTKTLPLRYFLSLKMFLGWGFLEAVLWQGVAQYWQMSKCNDCKLAISNKRGRKGA